MSSFAAQALGVNPLKIVADATGGDTLGKQLVQQVDDQEAERKKKLTGLGGATSLAAQSLLGNTTGGFGG